MDSAFPNVESTFHAALLRALGPEGAARTLASLGVAGLDAAFVGGWVRDTLRGQPSEDVDLVALDADLLATALVERGAKKAVLLDPARRTFRVVLDGVRYVDVCAMRGGNLHEDLRARDFTVNAIAWVPGVGLIDPLDGITHCAQAILHLASPQALTDDPLRGLRALRLCATLGMSLGSDVSSRLPGLDLRAVARERTQRETSRLLGTSRAGALLSGIPWAEALVALPGEIDMATLVSLEDRPWPTEGPVARCVTDTRAKVPTALALGRALCASVTLPEAASELMGALHSRRWSDQESRAASVLASAHRLWSSRPEPGQPPSRIARARLLVGWGGHAAWALLGLSLACPPSLADTLVGVFLDDLDGAVGHIGGRPASIPALPEPVCSLDPVFRRFGPGPWIGAARSALVEAQLSGVVRSRASARDWLERWIEEQQGRPELTGSREGS